MIDLSIIVVTFNSGRHIAACLASLRRAMAGVTAEIVVVDNASSDDTRAVLQAESGVRVIAMPANRGFAGGVNAGLQASTGRYAAWINPDTEVVGGSFFDVISWLDAHPEAGVAGLRLVDGQGNIEPSDRGFPGFHSAVGHRYSLLTRLWPGNPFSRRYLRTGADRAEIRRADWVSGAALVHRRALAKDLGGLDEDFFMYCEDVDFCYRASKQGSETWYVPLMTLRHEIGASSAPVKRAMIRARHASLWRYYRKHYRRHPLRDAAAYAGIFARCRWLLVYDALGGRRVK